MSVFSVNAWSGAGQFSNEWITDAVTASRLEQQFFYSDAARSKVSFHVYKPKSYNADKTRRFPVIYWLHGHGDAVNHLNKIVEYFDQAMNNGKIPEAIVVFPNGMLDSMWCNSKDGSVMMESVIIDDMIPEIDSRFRTIATSNGRLIEGFSMGGYGAARFGIKYPDVFGAFSMLGAGPMQEKFDVATGPRNLSEDRARILHNVYGDDQEYFRQLSPLALAKEHINELRGKSKIRIIVGERDAMLIPNQKFDAYLLHLGIEHSFYLIPDAVHNPIMLLNGMGEENWNFYREVLNRDCLYSCSDSKSK